MAGFKKAGAAIVALFLLCAGAAPALAQAGTSAPPVDEAKLKAARALLESTNADAQFSTIIPLMFNQMRRSLPEPGPNQKEQAEEVFNEIEKQFLERHTEIIDQIAVLYARRFTAEEMNTLADFYRSPIGQKFVTAMPELAAEAMTLGNAWGQKIAREAEQKIREEFKKRGLKL
ncbi:MAG: DUF2059 domain-containing protein [Rhodomicrobiaceae bacterium]